MNRSRTLILTAALAAAALSGCAGTGTTAPGAPATPSPPDAASAAPSPTPSPTPTCLTNSCVAALMDRTLTGFVAKDEDVATKVTCEASTVRHTPGVWTAACTVRYSSGQVWSGHGNWVVSTREVTFEPETEISGG